jgi:hypothetical protein
MRWRSFAVALSAVLALAEGTSFAAPSEKGKGGSAPGGSGGGGASGGSTGGANSGLSSETERDVGARNTNESTDKPWAVEASYEFHHLIRQSDLGGDALNKNFNYWLAGGSYDVTPRDRLMVRFGVYERFLRDSGETGARLDDTIVSYTHFFSLPEAFRLRAQVRTVIPLSYESKLQSLITAPRASLFLERKFGPFEALLLGFVEGYVERYKESAGGSANPTMRLGALAELDFTLPFHKALMIGVDAYSASTWFYETQGAPPSGSGSFYGSSTDPNFTGGQPVNQVYGGEIFVRYRLPAYEGIVADVQAAYANGDPVLGYQSSLHDGVFRFNGFYRHVAEAYFTLNAHY